MGNDEIEKYRHDLEVIRNTAKQVIKDFGLYGIEIIFSGNELTAYDELKQQLVPALAKLYQSGTFTALLYRIDVDEKKVNEIMNNTAAENKASQLASLVIEREFIKVLLRKLYQ